MYHSVVAYVVMFLCFFFVVHCTYEIVLVYNMYCTSSLEKGHAEGITNLSRQSR